MQVATSTVLVENDISTPSKTTLSGLQKFGIAYDNVHGYLIILLFVFGVIFNVLSIVVLTRKHMRSPTNFILTSLAIADMVVLASEAIYIIHHYFLLNPDDCHSPYRSKSWMSFYLFGFALHWTSQFIATWLNVSLTVFRYIYVRMHHRASTMCTMMRAKMTLGIVCLAAVLVSLPQYFSRDIGMTYINVNSTSIECGYKMVLSQAVKSHVDMYKAIRWIWGILIRLVPCILMATLSIRLIMAVQKAKYRRRRLSSTCSATSVTLGTTRVMSREQEDRTTMMLVIIVVSFTVSSSLDIMLFLISLQSVYFKKHVYLPLVNFTSLLVIMNSAINFIVYCTMSKQFRDTLTNLFFSMKIFSFFHCFQKYEIAKQQRMTSKRESESTADSRV